MPPAYNQYYYPGVVDLNQPSFWIAAGAICFNPLFWNTVAQNEYHRGTITKVLRGKRYLGCYLLGATIFILGIIRDQLYNQALVYQPVHPLLLQPFIKPAAAALFSIGNVLVLSSMYALGITGTYLGDYFGILMDDMVTGFPFNIVRDPMYVGSTLSFFSVALWFGKPAGLILSTLVFIVYLIAMRFEGPFTANIYVSAAKKRRGRTSANGESAATIIALQAEGGPARNTRSHDSPARGTRSKSKKSE
ncbi:putative OPI3-methylene-fatty-acyl-phospholipid synthase [Tilletiaria anomala UBC 951]|uniref:Phosphatidyl-N-methylethanolamine N-methyltransferase n=1 Tax=Tilletiaria anomala (strain ATCC 24038 / CBS 436.72 / UBC 951) TaxID=1037660 RepID=A0A066WRL6_TILAU|nr:putative OPI3-methylene-fatty-acyl-phospholipid synthase [Tilletiaria anomala UBC 951]KDN53644.1 putative OPI3-methylene-fatty-acyl-phospholipid synthase [Tilletiaria anomala UBC 951]